MILLFSFLTLFVFFSSSVPLSAEEGKTEVFVLGTLHNAHKSNKNYSYQDILNILGTYDADAICVEIPESFFRERPYLLEMTMASIYGFENNKNVYPIDWWNVEKNARKEREEYVKTDEYKKKEIEEERRKQDDSIIQSFEKEYGSLEKLFNENNKDYYFYNGKEFNDYIRQSYGISIDVYGYSCINLYASERNEKMMDLIKNAILENKGKRIIILTGAEHKYYFDDSLSKMKDVKLIQLKDLKIKKVKASKNIKKLIDFGLTKGYFRSNSPNIIDNMYMNALIPLTHGPSMDEKPSIVPKENIKKALYLLKSWKDENDSSVLLQFESAWVKFLKKDYKNSIKNALLISDKLDSVPKNMKWFVKPFYFRNLGFAYDMLGKREEAIASYKECRKACVEFGMEDEMIKNICKNYENEPYKEVNK